jgi:hypothetical protein
MDSISNTLNYVVEFNINHVNIHEYSSRIIDICADLSIKFGEIVLYSEKSVCIYELAIAIQKFLKFSGANLCTYEFSYISIESDKPFVLKIYSDGQRLTFINGLSCAQESILLGFEHVFHLFRVFIDNLKRHFFEIYGITEDLFLSDCEDA